MLTPAGVRVLHPVMRLHVDRHTQIFSFPLKESSTPEIGEKKKSTSDTAAVKIFYYFTTGR